jgi:hypothetical protein
MREAASEDAMPHIHPYQEMIPDDLIRQRAHHIWEREGKPEGRAEEHWQMARTELGNEMALRYSTEPNPAAWSEVEPHPEPIEPIEAVENQGSIPGLTDQDEEQQYPVRLKKARGKRTDREDRTDLPEA